MIVQDKLTPLGRDEAGRAFLAAYQQLVGRSPTQAVLALLLAQSAFETGHWKSLHHYNFGNAKAHPNYPLITQFRCSEVDQNGVETFYDPPHPQCNFRAYETPAAGALDYLKVLQNRPHWWQGLHTGDPAAFVDALSTPPKYFTGNPTVYKRSVVSLFNGFFPLAKAALTAPATPVAPSAPTPPRPSPAPVPALSSSSASPPSDSSGVRPAPSSAPSSVSPTPVKPAPASAPSNPTAEQSSGVAVKRSFWGRLVELVLRIARALFRILPPGSSP
ncbi:MAG TPA: hypothetical protein VJN18_02720 [Polyangiaceae bacterium]|nr:hypothetical protein [Polyangiaceae bacterium]